MFSYMYEVEFPRLDLNANNVTELPVRPGAREKSARERGGKLRRSKSEMSACRPKAELNNFVRQILYL